MDWTKLQSYGAEVADRSILPLFEDSARAGAFSVRACDMLLDYSKTNIDATARDLLLKLADDANLADRRAAMFSGAQINETEGRAVLHTALRAGPEASVMVEGQDIGPDGCVLRRGAQRCDQDPGRRDVHRCDQYRHRRF
jgi:glucose-6-phosphate isomerase